MHFACKSFELSLLSMRLQKPVTCDLQRGQKWHCFCASAVRNGATICLVVQTSGARLCIACGLDVCIEYILFNNDCCVRQEAGMHCEHPALHNGLSISWRSHSLMHSMRHTPHIAS